MSVIKGAAYLEDLEDATAQGCTTPGCNHEHSGPLYLHPMCHKFEGKLEVSFKFGDDHVVIACAQCHSEVIRVQVASKGREEC
ncbi:MAG: hypothetical protein KAJ55_03375 [Anaerolineales bacterium]|nr:hypothetical protein [Anaerolineales bacterium]